MVRFDVEGGGLTVPGSGVGHAAPYLGLATEKPLARADRGASAGGHTAHDYLIDVAAPSASQQSPRDFLIELHACRERRPVRGPLR